MPSLISDGPDRGPVRERLAQMHELLTTLDAVAERFLADPQAARAALAWVTGLGIPGTAPKHQP